MARKLDLDKNKIYYSAPGKTLKDIEVAINESNLIADSIEEIRRINMVSESLSELLTTNTLRVLESRAS